MSSIAITADNHLDFCQYGFEMREADYRKAFQQVTRYCENNKLPLIIAGDIFNTARPSGDLVYWLEQQLKNIEAYGIDGNHDVTANCWLKVCGITPLDNTVVLCGDFKVAGMNWRRPAVFMSELDNLIATIKEHGGVQVVVLHQLIDEFVPYRTNQVVASRIAEKLRPHGVKYVVAGDIHDGAMMDIGGIKFIYPGSTELNSISENIDKSFIVLHFDPATNEITHERIPLITRPFVHKLIQTEKELDDVLQAYCKEGQHPFIVLEYDNNARDLARRAEVALTGRAMFKLVPFVKSDRKSLLTQLSTEGFARYGAVTHLRGSIQAFFEPSSDEYQLITRLLEAPDQIDHILTTYGKNKGIL